MVEKTIHLTGTSTNSIEDAVGLAVTRAAATIDGIRQAEIAGVTAVDEFGTSRPHRELARAEVYLHPLEAQAAAAIARIPAENTAYLARHGVPVVPPDRRLPPPSRFFGTWFAPAEPDHLIADEDDLPLGDGRSLQVVWTPGHTPGHCCLLLLPERVLFVGDHLLPKITPHVGLWPGGPENPLGDFLGSHEKVQKVDARLVCPAHGAVYEDHRRRARQL